MNQISANYTRTGVSESRKAPFTVVATATVNTYGGFVEITVSGTGHSFFGELNATRLFLWGTSG